MMAEQASRVAIRALACMDELIKMYEGDEVVKHWHEQADFKVRRQKRPDYYAILGVSSVASEPEIKAFAAGFGATFPMFSKIDVNGKNAHPLYVWLKSSQGGTLGDNIKWNFGKFLTDRYVGQRRVLR